MGYCGADLRSLCTEAALFALRRRYPQIYNSTEKLVLDTTKIRISSTDFQNALKMIVPTAQRSDSSVARALPPHLHCVFVPSLRSLLGLVSFIFSPAWKSVRDASKELELLVQKLDSKLQSISQHLQELGKKSPPTAAQWSGGSGNCVANHLPSALAETSGVLERNRINRSISNDYLSNSKSSHKPHSPSNATGTSGMSNSFHASKAGPYTETSVLQQQGRMNQSIPNNSRKTQQRGKKSSFQDLCQSQLHPSDLGRVFFDLTELSSEGEGARNGSFHREGSCSILQEEREKRSVSERSSDSCSHSMELCRYLGSASHPHKPPTVHYPRLLLCGLPAMGQSMYLAPALLHALEDFPVKTVDLLTVFGSSTKSPEEACTQVSVMCEFVSNVVCGMV